MFLQNHAVLAGTNSNLHESVFVEHPGKTKKRWQSIFALFSFHKGPPNFRRRRPPYKMNASWKARQSVRPAGNLARNFVNTSHSGLTFTKCTKISRKFVVYGIVAMEKNISKKLSWCEICRWLMSSFSTSLDLSPGHRHPLLLLSPPWKVQQRGWLCQKVAFLVPPCLSVLEKKTVTCRKGNCLHGTLKKKKKNWSDFWHWQGWNDSWFFWILVPSDNWNEYRVPSNSNATTTPGGSYADILLTIAGGCYCKPNTSPEGYNYSHFSIVRTLNST